MSQLLVVKKCYLHRLHLWRGFNPWPENFHMPQVWQKKKKILLGVFCVLFLNCELKHATVGKCVIYKSI